MSTSDSALLAKLSKLSPAQREALLKKLQHKKSQKTPSLKDMAIPALPRDKQDFCLSFAQQRLWFLEQLDPGSATYNIAAALQLSGKLKPELLNQTFKRIIHRHESLRTVFIDDKDGPKQRILNDIDWQMDISDCLPADVEQHIFNEANTGFNLATGPLLRAKLLRTSNSEHTLIVVMHHIISDAWSSQILLAEVSRFYSALHQGTTVAMPNPAIQYVDYSLWQREYLAADAGLKQLDYWKAQLRECSNLQLASDKARPSVLSYHGAIVRESINAADTAQFKRLCQAQGATTYIGLMAAFQSLIYRHSQQLDFCVGTPAAGRNHADLEPLIGFFVNSLAIVNNANGDISFNELINNVKQTVLEAQSYQDIPFEQLVDKISPERDGSYSPIFQVFFSYNPGDADSQLQLPGIKATFLPADTETAKFDLSLIVSDKVIDGQETLSLHFEYNTDIYQQPAIARMAQHFITLFKQACLMPDAPLHSLHMLDVSETDALQQLSTGETVALTDSPDIASLFEHQAHATPLQTAVQQGNNSLSFSALNASANQLADYMLNHGVTQGDYIGLCFPPSSDLMIALLATIKLGAIYVPMDPAYPSDRLSYMAEHANLKLLLTAERIDTAAINMASKVNIDQLTLSEYSSLNPTRDISADQPLYVIYTSGSTGLPKAAMVSHANEYNLLQWYGKQYDCNHDQRILVFSAIGFDLTQKNLLTPLCFGAQLHFTEQEWYDPEAIISTIAEQKISWLNCAPSAFYPLIDSCTDFKQLNSLKQLFFGGEPIQLKNMANWLHSPYCNVHITNMYGPTECTDIAATYTIKDAQHHRGGIPIGRPNANVSLHILDDHLNRVPQGAIGELHIGGASVGLGYLNNPVITAERFISNPFTTSGTHARLYKTGDLVRQREDGELEFIARCDDQIKIRGFRIELGEIENQLRDIHDVQDAVVCTRNISGQTQLLAFIVSAQPLQEQHFYKHSLNQHLPDYMVPIAYLAIDTIPLSANGKVARNKLPDIDLSSLKQAEYIAPRNTDEAELAMIWQNLLGIENIGVRDNFFELGGHSLLATQMLTRIRDGFEVEFPLRTIFEVSTIEGLVEIITAMKPTSMDTAIIDDDDDEAFEEGML